MAVKKRGGDHWHFDFQIRGKRYREAIPEARTKWDAEEAETSARKKVFDGTYRQPQLGNQLFSEFVKQTYLPSVKTTKKTWKQDEGISEMLIEKFRGKTLREISPLDIEKLKRDRRNGITKRGGPRAPSSVNSELSVLSGIFKMAVNCEQADKDPTAKVKPFKLDNQQFRYLTWEEEPALLSVLDNPTLKIGNHSRLRTATLKVWREARAVLRDAVLIAVGSGLRRGEQLGLKSLHCDFNRNVIIVTKTKTSKNRNVPMNDEVRAILQRLCRGKRRDDYLFKNPKTGKPFKDFDSSFARACEDAEIEGLAWKDLRATFGTRLGEAGYNAFEIAALMGHSDIKTTQRYVRVEPRIHEAVQATMSSRRMLKLA
jgi:integrase